MSFFKKLEELQNKNKSLVCVGLDVDLNKTPEFINDKEDPVFYFNKEIIDATKDLVCCYKPNIAFYEALGIDKGLNPLKKTVAYLYSLGIPVIIDAKRNDIGNTAAAHAKAIFGFYKSGAITINPYMGSDSMTPFLDYQDNGVFIIARTSNPGARDFQDLIFNNKPLYKHVIEKCLELDEHGNVGFVVGATCPEELKEARRIAPNSVFLIPGIGAQGGDVEKTIKAGVRKDSKGVIINSARGIIYASSGPDFAKAARIKAKELRDEINKHRNV